MSFHAALFCSSLSGFFLFYLTVHNNNTILTRVFCVQWLAGPVLVGACVNHKDKNLSPAGFRGTVPNQIYALTFLQGKKSPPAAK